MVTVKTDKNHVEYMDDRSFDYVELNSAEIANEFVKLANKYFVNPRFKKAKYVIKVYGEKHEVIDKPVEGYRIVGTEYAVRKEKYGNATVWTVDHIPTGCRVKNGFSTRKDAVHYSILAFAKLYELKSIGFKRTSDDDEER